MLLRMPGEWLRPLMTKSGFMYDNPSEKRAYSRGRCGGVGLGILAALDNKKPKVIPILPARGKCGSGEENGGNLCSCKTADFDDSRPFTFKPANFLYSCYLCRRRLSQEKDIYMYRGDQAFCSEECRYQKIVSDERKERCLSSVSSFNVCSSSIFTITT